jgi:hypothetical protein
VENRFKLTCFVVAKIHYQVFVKWKLYILCAALQKKFSLLLPVPAVATNINEVTVK